MKTIARLVRYRFVRRFLIWVSPFIFLLPNWAVSETMRHHRVSTEDPSFPAELIKAEAAIDKQDYATARPLLESVVEANPNNFQAWFDLGFVFHALQKPDESISAYRKAVAVKPDVFESNLNLGLELAQSGSPDAEEFLRKATTLVPTDRPDEGRERAWLALAHFTQIKRPGEAIEAYRQAAIIQPKDPEPHLSAGLLLEKQKNYSEAESEYSKALALQPSSSDALTGLANTYMEDRRFADAEPILRQLVTLHPTDASVHMQLGRMLAIAGKNDDAISELQAGLKLSPGDKNAELDLADLLVTAGKYDEATNIYRRLLLASPKDPDLHEALGKAFLKQRKFADAQQEFMTTVQLKPDFGAAYGDLAVAADENKNYALAIKAADLRGKFLPEIPISYFLRATAYDHLHDRKQAALNYHRFLEVDGGKLPDQEWQATHRLIALEPKR